MYTPSSSLYICINPLVSQLPRTMDTNFPGYGSHQGPGSSSSIPREVANGFPSSANQEERVSLNHSFSDETPFINSWTPINREHHLGNVIQQSALQEEALPNHSFSDGAPFIHPWTPANRPSHSTRAIQQSNERARPRSSSIPNHSFLVKPDTAIEQSHDRVHSAVSDPVGRSNQPCLPTPSNSLPNCSQPFVTDPIIDSAGSDPGLTDPPRYRKLPISELLATPDSEERDTRLVGERQPNLPFLQQPVPCHDLLKLLWLE